MELAEISKPLPNLSDQVSVNDTDLSKSLISIQSKNVSEVAAEEIENIPVGIAPGNPLLVEDSRSSTPTKTTTIIDDNYEVATITNLKKFQKLQHARQKKYRNKVAPSETSEESERPTSAPSNRTRQWLKEINENRPTTAAPRVSLTKPPVTEPEETVLERQVSKETIKSDKNEEIKNIVEVEEKHDDVSEFESNEPAVNETAYIPYDHARAMIIRVVDDMNNMKSNHLSIIKQVEDEYEKMEKHTQGQFNDCVLQLQERHKRRTQHYRQVIELLHSEIKTKGSLRSEAIQNLKERNKELAMERKRIQQSLSRSNIQFVPSQPDNKKLSDAKKTSEEEEAEEEEKQAGVEEKVVEDAKEREKKLSRESSRESIPVALTSELAVKKEDGAEEDKEVEGPGSESEQEEAEEEEELDETPEEKKVESESDEEVIEDVAKVAIVKKVADDKEEPDEKKPEDGKKKAKPKLEKKKSKAAVHKSPEVMSSAEQTQLNKQQNILATKQAKKIKELEKQLEAVNRRVEHSRKSAKNVDVELENAKSEAANLKKLLAEQKAELSRLEKAAGAGAAALEQLPELKEEVKTLTSENQTLITNYNSERVLRKKYYNMVEDMKGKIRVYCRVRPLSKTEKGNKNKTAVLVPDEYTVKIDMNRGGTKEFQFDQIFSESASQENVFEDTHSLIQSAVDGYNVCIFAYGQTGSGKTYTMIGDNGQTQPGIAPRAFSRIFDIAEKNKKKFTFKISCYMLELYNEKLVDLLSKSKDDPVRLDIKKDNKGMVVVQGTETVSADNSDDLFKVFLKGSANRHTASTKMNEDSSRSHLVVGVIIESVNLTSGAITRGKLSLVDLAGSERVAKTGATADQLKEANSINKSLSALGDVISALSSEQSFIPYRNNKLTMLMQDSLGGNAKTLMFVNISPADYNSDESAISLTYASRVKLIKNDASKMADSKEVARLKAIIAKLKSGEKVEE